ncbi:hypothetical protein, unknown function [Leishmania donovani]|uniref:Tyrosine phosphatase family protein n=1 Tax=Leishmania donovani TaxID=5661 RepID=A0A3S7X743_LEIDO|nr:hypothetical protein, unknown function [Leishmania donovani]AYU82281.1 Tyrosine phosphatase family/Tyrosine phosphatase family C-terminal region containing protein, putative [Leishmania donovani]TPP53581.1 Tyrosine phosphatase family protein [Leishmania donovani]CBZ37441.1 hypothetical protein, unknown function [Leishmania donovani]
MTSVIQRLRRVEVEGLENLRNLGGYHTNNSTKTKRRGVVYRSDQLFRIPACMAQRGLVDQLRIRHVYDLCDSTEVSEKRYSLLHMQHTSLPIDMSNANRFLKEGENLKQVATAHRFMQEIDREFVRSYALTVGLIIKGIIGSKASCDKAFLIHCTAGKDRTGWCCYVLLTLLDVTEKEKRADYLLTNTFVGIPADAWDYSGAEGMSEEAMAALWAAFNEYLDAALDELSKMGGIYKYAKSHMGLTDEDIDELRELMLE